MAGASVEIWRGLASPSRRAARELWQIFRRHPWLAPAYSLTRPLIVPSGLPYSESVLATLLDRRVKPATAFSMHLILFNFVRGFATSLEMEATAEADTGVTADEWMDVRSGWTLCWPIRTCRRWGGLDRSSQTVKDMGLESSSRRGSVTY